VVVWRVQKVDPGVLLWVCHYAVYTFLVSPDYKALPGALLLKPSMVGLYYLVFLFKIAIAMKEAGIMCRRLKGKIGTCAMVKKPSYLFIIQLI